MRHARDLELATAFRRWARRVGIPATELAEAFEVSERVVRDLLSGEKPLHASDILRALPRTYRARFLAELDREFAPTGTDHG